MDDMQTSASFIRPIIHSRNSRKWLNALFLLALASILPGCTQKLWQNVPADRTDFGGIAGVTKPDATGKRRIVLTFGASNAPPAPRVIQLDAGGLPPEPFRYTGALRDADQILAELGERKTDLISSYELKPADQDLNNLPPARIEQSEEGYQIQAGYYRWRPSGGVVIIAYKIDADGNIHIPAHTVRTQWRAIEPGFNVLVIPVTQPRPFGQVFGERWLPTLLTPITFAVDVVSTPFIGVGFVIGTLSMHPSMAGVNRNGPP